VATNSDGSVVSNNATISVLGEYIIDNKNIPCKERHYVQAISIKVTVQLVL